MPSGEVAYFRLQTLDFKIELRSRDPLRAKIMPLISIVGNAEFSSCVSPGKRSNGPFDFTDLLRERATMSDLRFSLQH